MKWYCWEIWLKVPGSRTGHEIRFVVDENVSDETAQNRAKVALIHTLQTDASFNAKVTMGIKHGPYDTIAEAAAKKDAA